MYCDWFVILCEKGTRKIEIIHLNSPATEAIVDCNGKACIRKDEKP
jgi:hypothetical protein